MSIARQRFFLFCSLVVFLIASCAVYFQKVDFFYKAPYQRFLQKTSFEERMVLNYVCKELFLNSSMGYTLFGDKPMSVICDFDRPDGGRRFFFVKQLIPIVRRYEKQLNSSRFVLLINDESTGVALYLINKMAFLDVFRKNILVVRNILGNSCTPEKLLHLIENKSCTVETALKGNHALFGILFGYGTENALNFDRRHQLEESLYIQGEAPWKDLNSLEGMETSDVIMFNLQRKYILNKRKVKEFSQVILSASDRSSILNELDTLNKKLFFVGGSTNPPNVGSSISLPSFVGDTESSETRALLEKYDDKRLFLTKLLEDDKFFEKVLETFYAPRDE